MKILAIIPIIILLLSGCSKSETPVVDPVDDITRFTDDEVMDLVQKQTIKYFWDFADPTSGLAKERNSSGTTVTTGGSGFGFMALIAGVERGFIDRSQFVTRMDKVTTFLENADRFHGAWSHWIDGSTGTVRPFSSDDNGADLVETAFLIQGLLTVKEYLDPAVESEKVVIDRIEQLWQEVEWSWFTKNGSANALYWHWSPNYGWQKNMAISGWNEALIVYVLAASSPTYPISADVYHKGWAQNGALQNGTAYFNNTLPLGIKYGGPLFFAHYSFLGLDPRGLSDRYANYWEQNVAHTKINYDYCVSNPYKFEGYSSSVWGLTASDQPTGYSAHAPHNFGGVDNGTITPTAAISSIPYTPTESLAALHYFYEDMHDTLWGEYGFYDAFNESENWTATSTLAIDQGPIVVMIENYRTGLLWNNFMKNSDIQRGLEILEFTSN